MEGEQKEEQKDLTYLAEAGHITAELTIKRGEKYGGGIGLQVKKLGYKVEMNFYGRAFSPSVTYHYETSDLTDMFMRLKEANEGVERLLAEGLHPERVGERNVLRCIFSLEDQLKKVGNEVR